LDEFDRQAAFVLYYENEEEANRGLLDPDLLERVRRERQFQQDHLLAMLRHNAPDRFADWKEYEYDDLFEQMLRHTVLKIAVVIAGQGPLAFGMPEMFTPMQHINANQRLKRIATLVSDGRYSGASYGAAIGHMTPEAIAGGGILYLQTGDVLVLRLREQQIQWLEPEAFAAGRLEFDFTFTREQRQALGGERLLRIRGRQRLVAASNRMADHTDAAHGVVPFVVAEEAVHDYRTEVTYLINPVPTAEVENHEANS
jgi:hypothetical protein